MFNIAALVIVLAAILVLYRAIKGPKIFDRVLAVNVIGTKTVVLLALIGYIFERPHFLDIALVYAAASEFFIRVLNLTCFAKNCNLYSVYF